MYEGTNKHSEEPVRVRWNEDTDRYEDYSNRVKKTESIKKAMGERLEDANKMFLYTPLAESDPKMKRLLDELEELEKED